MKLNMCVAPWRTACSQTYLIRNFHIVKVRIDTLFAVFYTKILKHTVHRLR